MVEKRRFVGIVVRLVAGLWLAALAGCNGASLSTTVDGARPSDGGSTRVPPAHRASGSACPTARGAGNICTGALAKQLQRKDARIEDHPLPKLLRHGIPIVLSTDDPAMFHSTLQGEYENARRMRLTEQEIASLQRASFEHAFAFDTKLSTTRKQ